MYMRKTIIMFLMLVACLSATAQTGLKINELFEGRIIPQERMMETRVRGKSIAKYQLTYYRSLRLNVTNKEAGQLRQLLGQDTERSIDWRTSRKNPHSWDTWTCKMQMPSAGNKLPVLSGGVGQRARAMQADRHLYGRHRRQSGRTGRTSQVELGVRN